MIQRYTSEPFLSPINVDMHQPTSPGRVVRVVGRDVAVFFFANYKFTTDMSATTSTWGRMPDGSRKTELLTLMELPEYAYVATVRQMLPAFAMLVSHCSEVTGVEDRADDVSAVLENSDSVLMARRHEIIGLQDLGFDDYFLCGAGYYEHMVRLREKFPDDTDSD